MKYFDFRWFLEDLDKKGELFRVPVEVDTLDEMGAFIARADYEDIHTPILFESQPASIFRCLPTPWVTPIGAWRMRSACRKKMRCQAVP